MSVLIHDLQKEHESILDVIRSMHGGQGVAGRDAREKLILAKRLFLSHLEKEDQELYPVLRKAAPGSETEKRLKDSDKELQEVSQIANAFFAKYLDGNQGGDFIADSANFLYRLEARLVNEEAFLYQEYDRMTEKQ